MLKTVSRFISDIMAHIFNKCIEISVRPDALKIAEVPIYKTGNKNLISNYHPISLISNIAKILEKVLHNRLYTFLTKYKILALLIL